MREITKSLSGARGETRALARAQAKLRGNFSFDRPIREDAASSHEMPEAIRSTSANKQDFRETPLSDALDEGSGHISKPFSHPFHCCKTEKEGFGKTPFSGAVDKGSGRIS